MEAFREGGPDIEAKGVRGDLTAFEVKFIGQDDDGFDTVLKGFRGEDAYGRSSPYLAANYLLHRVYQSAKQLQRSAASTRIALVVIDDTYDTFERLLKGRWINWANPTFVDVYDPFIERERVKNPNLDTELKVILGSINGVWILKRSSGNQFQLMFSQGGKCGWPTWRLDPGEAATTLQSGME